MTTENVLQNIDTHKTFFDSQANRLGYESTAEMLASAVNLLALVHDNITEDLPALTPTEALKAVREIGYTEGYSDGFASGYKSDIAYSHGYSEGFDACREEGFDDHETGYDVGYEDAEYDLGLGYGDAELGL
jgi:hypothetical protein